MVEVINQTELIGTIANMTNGTTTMTTEAPGVDIEFMGKMMSFTFGAVCFVLLLLLLDQYDRRYSGYVKTKCLSCIGSLWKSSKDTPKESDPREAEEEVITPLQECKPSTSTSVC